MSEGLSHQPGLNRNVRMRVSLPNRAPIYVCFFCVSGCELVDGVFIEGIG